MSGFIDFAELKRQVSIERAADLLGLKTTPQGNHQLRAPCPACKGNNDRALVITPQRELFYCFTAQTGGDAIKLVAHVRGIEVKEAAHQLAGMVATVPTVQNGTVSKSRATVPENEKGALKPLDYLVADHELVQGLGLSAEVCREWGAGYAPKGIMRGRLAIPIRDRHGTLIAYCGRAVKGESPELLFPNGFDPSTVIFAADRVEEGFLYLVPDPVDVLKAHDNGITNVIAYLSHVTPQWLEMLASLMDERKCEALGFFAH